VDLIPRAAEFSIQVLHLGRVRRHHRLIEHTRVKLETCAHLTMITRRGEAHLLLRYVDLRDFLQEPGVLNFHFIVRLRFSPSVWVGRNVQMRCILPDEVLAQHRGAIVWRF